MRKHEFKQLAETDDNIKKAIAGMRDVLNVFDDPSREGLDETPLRYVKFMHEFLNPEPFEYSEFNAEGTDEMIVVSNGSQLKNRAGFCPQI